MKVVLQRVQRAHVEVYDEVIGQIPEGLLLLLGVKKGDTEQDADWLIEKVLNLRVFSDEEGKMNLSVLDTEGSLLVVSQFTLYADCRKGTRPGFGDAALPEDAERLYDYFVQQLIDRQLHVESGKFGAKMEVTLVNDGPVTMVVGSPSSV